MIEESVDYTFQHPLFWIFAECPLFLVWVGGMLLALFWWRRHPKVSLTATIALCLFCLEAVIWPILERILSHLLSTANDWGNPSSSSIFLERYNLIFLVIGFLRAALEACFFCLLLLAIFGWRQREDVVLPPIEEKS
jgi:hypothetical protein